MTEVNAAPADLTSEPPCPTSALPRISVIIPAHDEAAYIERALASVIAQDYPPECLDCVVVDSASSDDTSQIATAFAARHPARAITVVREPVAGVSRAKNAGARHARGTILFFLDADSRIELGLASEIAAHYRRGWPAGCMRIVADSDDWLERGYFDLMEVGPLLFGVRALMPYCDRALFDAVGGFREDLCLAEDLEFLRRVRRAARLQGKGGICHITRYRIATSPRRLRAQPYHLGLVLVFARWALAFIGVGRRRRYT